MGAAKRRAVDRARFDVEVDIPRLAAAMRKYALAASDRLGSDSYIHAAIVREVLAQIECRGVPRGCRGGRSLVLRAERAEGDACRGGRSLVLYLLKNNKQFNRLRLV